MILHFLARSILPLRLVSTSTKAEVSAILPSEPRLLPYSSLHTPIHTAPNHHLFRSLAISCSYPTHLSNLISSAPHSHHIIQNT
jgi:hypothetical protein